MTISASHSFLSEILSGEPIPPNKLGFFRARLQSRLYDFVITKFLTLEREGKITRAELARRIGRKPEQITRWLGTPGNWTTDTASDLLLGIAGEELELFSVPLANRTPRNYQHPEWISPPGSSVTISSTPMSFIGPRPRSEDTSTVGTTIDHGVRITSTA